MIARPDPVLAVAALALLFALQGARADAGTASVASPLGLPALVAPGDNALTEAKIELGRRLFSDERLSANGTMSCALCHLPEQGFTSNELATPVGSEGRSLRRNAPTLLNVALRSVLFHDGREESLERQVWGPLLERREMGNVSVDQVLQRIAAIPGYRGLFQEAFGEPEASADGIGQAVASYERTLLAGNSPFDRWFYAKDASALSAQEQAGFTVFNWSGCGRCHSVGEQSALFTDDRFHNLGTGWAHSQRGGEAIILAPGLRAQIDAADLARISEAEQPDDGRFEVTRDANDRWAYRTPTLRNVALSAPYMHDGSLATLEQVIDYYDQGGNQAPDKDPFLKILNLTRPQKLALAAFLRSLTGDNVELLAQKARASPLSSAVGER